MVQRLKPGVSAALGFLLFAGAAAVTDRNERLGFFVGLFDVRLLVVDARGACVPDAEVWVFLKTGTNPGEGGDEEKVGVTGADGRIEKSVALSWCALTGPGAQEKVRLRVEVRKQGSLAEPKEFKLRELPGIRKGVYDVRGQFAMKPASAVTTTRQAGIANR